MNELVTVHPVTELPPALPAPAGSAADTAGGCNTQKIPCRLAWSLGTAAILVAGGMGLLIWQAGSADAALAQLRGDVLTVHPTLIDLGRQAPGTVREAVIEIRNHAAVPVRLVGGTTDCGCLATSDLPVTIPPGGSATLRSVSWFTGVVDTASAAKTAPGP